MSLRGVCTTCANKTVNVCYANILVFNKRSHALNTYYTKSGLRTYMFTVV